MNAYIRKTHKCTASPAAWLCAVPPRDFHSTSFCCCSNRLPMSAAGDLYLAATAISHTEILRFTGKKGNCWWDFL